MRKAFVISDIHGCYEPFMKLLENWNPEMELIILGDVINRGKDSLKVVQQLIKLKGLYREKVKIIKGNHEDMFLDFLDSPVGNGRKFDMVGGGETIISFAGDDAIMKRNIEDIARVVRQRAEREIDFIRNLPLYYAFGEVLFVHAGIDAATKDWRQAPDKDFMWYDMMPVDENKTGLTIVFGHTPTRILHQDRINNDVWVSEDGSYIGIDGGYIFGGQMNAIIIDERGEVLASYFETSNT
ncbi:serine/threonine protein phosphatase [Bacillus sp. AGMB 02131]|uniref:Serine/threonine protein phosphatase n=1 Tax=Peribacillus faecalis TaxID=2772559 RepID=A0A927HAI2_9BACI|nr:metallophosphoesterase family protein [Peribacillus faecalis]MBD3107481.1 serine/threonine protein phosphatase [Peribacillus faecalis]